MAHLAWRWIAQGLMLSMAVGCHPRSSAMEPVGGRPVVGESTKDDQAMRDLFFFFDDLHLFHRSGTRIWVDDGGQVVLFRLLRDERGGISEVTGQARLPDGEWTTMRDRVHAAAQLDCDLIDRPGIPDEVPVLVQYRAVDGKTQSFSTWEREWRSPELCPRGDALRRLADDFVRWLLDGHTRSRPLSEEDAGAEPPWPASIRRSTEDDTSTPAPPMQQMEQRMISMQVRVGTTVQVPGTSLTIHFAEAGAKVGAPVTTARLRFVEGELKGEVFFHIEAHQATDWTQIDRIWNAKTGTYLPEAAPLRQVRIVSVQEQDTNGAPVRMTLEIGPTQPDN